MMTSGRTNLGALAQGPTRRQAIAGFAMVCSGLAVVPQPQTTAKRLFCRRSRDFGMVILFR